MKTIVQINSVAYGSTGNIVKNISEISKEKGFKTIFFVGHDNGRDKGIFRIGNKFSNLSSIILSYVGLDGYGSFFSTIRFVNKLKKINPDIIHIHNIHGYYLNYKIFFNYLKKNFKGSIVWTLHDCWSFTGHCTHFEFENCYKWKKCCKTCPKLHSYPLSIFDTSKKMYKLKKKLFNNLKNITIVTPSKWLANHVNNSYLKGYEVKIINNGIDLDIFKPTRNNFRKKYNLENQKIILGVAFDWLKSKGIDIFIKLANSIPNDYKIVLVGTNETIEKNLPDNIISIRKTTNKLELVEIYSSANVFLNPTYEDTFPTVNIEALACGTPVITFDTGGSPEIISDKTGVVIEKKDYEKLLSSIINVCENNKFSNADCVARSCNFDRQEKFKEYVELYERLYKNNRVHEVKNDKKNKR